MITHSPTPFEYLQPMVKSNGNFPETLIFQSAATSISHTSFSLLCFFSYGISLRNSGLHKLIERDCRNGMKECHAIE